MNDRQFPAIVEVLLATFNGERFVGELLESLTAQSFGDWRVLVRDDGSTDGTLRVINEWSRRHPGRCTIIESRGSQRLGAAANFGCLLEASVSPIVALCDQDDVWHEDKLTLTVEAMRAAEARHGFAHPVLVHTNLAVVADDLRPLGASLWALQKTRPDCNDPVSVAMRNVVTGCSAVMNRALVKKAMPVPAGAAMHDWWCALVATTFGTVVALDEPLVFYRQHDSNEVGAVERSRRRAISKAVRFWRREDLRVGFASASRQAGAFVSLHGQSIEPALLRRLAALAEVPSRGRLGRRVELIRHRLFGGSLFSAIGLLVRI
jgi:glycosyltransferase involved in cell wall biosynthesis